MMSKLKVHSARLLEVAHEARLHALAEGVVRLLEPLVDVASVCIYIYIYIYIHIIDVCMCIYTYAHTY